MRHLKTLLAIALMASVAFIGSLAAVSEASHSTTTGKLVPLPRSSTIQYGDDPAQFGRLLLPDAEPPDGGYPVAMLIHGGFWKRSIGDLSLMDDLANRLVGEGFAVWNVEYGRVGERRGGWPHTFDHVGEAIDHIEQMPASPLLNSDKVVVVGHSAGGHLGLWLRTRPAADAHPQVLPQAVVALAPIVDLPLAWADDLGSGAVQGLLDGAPDEVGGRYAFASVTQPNTTPTLIITAVADDDVPPRYSTGVPNASYVELAPPTGHFGLIAGDGPAVDEALAWYRSLSNDKH